MMKQKWVTLLVGMMVGILALTGCGQKAQTTDEQGETGDLLARVQARGEMVIGTEGTWAPWTYHDEEGTLIGFDVEVAQHIAEKLGVTATFVEGEWDGLFAGMDAGRYDLVANGVEVTEQRAEKYDFSNPYAYIRTAIIVQGENTDIQSFEDLNGKRTANTLASTYAALATSFGAEAIGVEDLSQTIELLQAGRVDATLNAEVTYYDYLRAHPDADIKIAALTEEASLVSLPVCKGEDTASFLAALDQAIAELDEEGVLSELSVKYFGSDLTQGEN